MLIVALAVTGCAGAESQSDTGIDQAQPAPDSMAVEEPTAEEPAAEAAQPDVTEPEVEQEQAAITEPVTEPVEESAQSDIALEEEMAPPANTVNLNHMSDLLATEVWNRNNEQIGTINAVVINEDTSEIKYVIVGTGGFLGLFEKEIPAPWFNLEVKEAADAAVESETGAPADETQVAESPKNAFILDLNQDELEQAPELDLSPFYALDTADTATLQQLEEQIEALWQNGSFNPTAVQTDQAASAPVDNVTHSTGGDINLVLAVDLFGAMVDSTNGAAQQGVDQADTAQPEDQYLAGVEDITVDLDTGKIDYLLVYLNAAPDAVVEETQPDSADSAVQTPVDPYLGVPDSSVADIPAPQLVPVPLQAMVWDEEAQMLLYNGSQPLEQAPTIGLEEFESGQDGWQSEADSFWS